MKLATGRYIRVVSPPKTICVTEVTQSMLSGLTIYIPQLLISCGEKCAKKTLPCKILTTTLFLFTLYTHCSKITITITI